MYLSLVFLPLLGSIASGFFGFILGGHGAAIISTGLLGLTFICCLTAFYEVALCGNTCYVNFLPWIETEFFNVSWSFQFDSLTVVMLVVVTSISFLVHLYSTEYMSHDPHLPRFMSYLSLFTFFMLILVTADNFIQMFVGWEGVGLCSYLLINFWYTRIQANKAALKAMIMNRIGDFGLTLGMLAIYMNFGALDYSTVFACAPYFIGANVSFLNLEVNLLDLICLLLFVGAVGKSAQIGLHTWLPDAMEGPTPVSALIHAATMVTAGVFLIARCSPIFEFAPNALVVVTIVGATTAFYAATIGLVQNDIKRVIAYSTCSQLGYMVFACGLSNYHMAVFHLFNHAFFKALLFLCAGSVIHGVGDEQDMRKYGGLGKLLPFTFAMMTLGSFSLMGMPFLTGFYSKDAILEVAYGSYSAHGLYAYILGSCGAFCTAFYSMRLLALTFLVKPNGSRKLITNAHEPSWQMSLPLLILSFPTIFIGYLCKDMFIGLGSDFWQGALFIHPNNLIIVDAENIPQYVKLIPLTLAISGAVSSYYFYVFEPKAIYNLKTSIFGLKAYNFLNKKWFFDKIYNSVVGQFFLSFAFYGSYKNVDRGVLEHFGPYGFYFLASNLAQSLKRFQSGFFYHYAFAAIIFLIIVLGFFGLFLYDALLGALFLGAILLITFF